MPTTAIPNDVLSRFQSDVLRIAKEIGSATDKITRRDYRDNNPGLSSEQVDRVGGFSLLKNTVFPKPVYMAQVLRLKDIRKKNTALSVKLGSRDIFIEELKAAISGFPAVKVRTYKPRKPKSRIKRALNLVISDLHIASDLDPEEVGVRYGVVEEARFLAHIARTAIEYKAKYRDETELHVFLNGDIIANILHGASSADLLALQNCRAIWLLTQLIGILAQHFRKVVVHCTTGNHGRDIAIHAKRAVSQKFNSHETTIYYAVKTATRNLVNVSWDIPKTPWADAVILGHRMRSTHGDTHLNLGNPGTSLNIGTIEGKINKINASLNDKDEFEVFIVGHVHTPLVIRLSNGSFLVINGSAQPPDSYANTLDIVESRQVQVMFETTADHAVGDLRFIDMSASSHDRSLDSLIIPFPGLNG
jgi:hypothetical protein